MLNFTRIPCLGDALRDAFIAYPENTALIEADRQSETGRWTYAEARNEAERFATLLQDHGFESGDRCAILMSNQSRWILSGVGALWAGATLIPLDYKLTSPEQLALLAHGKPQALVTEYPLWKRLVEKDAHALDTHLVLVAHAPEDAELGTAIRWETSPGGTFQIHERGRDDVACIVYSSGTGGTPKGCVLTHANYLSQAEVLGQLFPMEEGERFFSILPTNHAIDFMCGFLLPLFFGATVVHQRTLRPQFLASTLKRYHITHMALVPMLLKALEKKIREKIEKLAPWKQTVVERLVEVNERATARKPNHRLSSTLLKPIHDAFGGQLKLLFCGGAFVEPDTASFFYRLGLPVVIGYGLTEAGTVVTVNDLKPFRCDTVGLPVPGTQLELRNRNGAGVGEVWVQGNTIMKGYLDAPELTKEVLVDGWLATGDLGSIDAAGHLKLVGRLRNMIVTEGGKNIYPEDVESAFNDVDGAEEHCVFATNFIWPKKGLTGEELTLVLRPDTAINRDELLQEMTARNRQLVDFKRISTFLFWEEAFPRTASMKIKRNTLAQALRENENREALRKVA